MIPRRRIRHGDRRRGGGLGFHPGGSIRYNRPVTHGKQLRVTDVGPWALQQVPKGTEALETMVGPGRGYWRFDAAIEITSDDAWPADDSDPEALNDPDLHQGKVTGSPMVIDGYTIPVGTYICQFRDFPDGYDFYCQGTSLPILFRGCRWRFSSGLSGAGLFNDNGATSAQRILLHYCDIGLSTRDLADGVSPGLMHIKLLGGLNHRAHRNHHTTSSTFFQPNTQGCVFTENIITDFIYPFGEGGVDGDMNPTHLNGISCEGGITDLVIARNRILAPSPDPTNPSTEVSGGTALGQPGYGTQPGQSGYGAGSNPGRVIGQTDCIALFSTNLLPNQGSSPGAILIEDNYLGGTGVCVYAGNALANCTNIHMIGNRVTTKWWTGGAQAAAITDVPGWGSDGNYQADNLYDDDYGTGGDGSTAIGDRQYPGGNGPLVGTSFA